MNKGVGEGSGLGLSMIYGFAKQADGHVKIYSEPDHGTTVKLYLPCALESTSTEGEASQSDEPFPLGTETVLIVEDDEQVRRFVAERVRSLGYTVLQAADGESALATLARMPSTQLLFTDVIMPGGIDRKSTRLNSSP